MPANNINHVVLTGRFTSDPDLRALPSGTGVCNMRVAVNGRRRDASGEWQEKPNFFDVVIYGARAETIARYVHKGRAVAIDGRLDWREWETQEGHRAQAVRVVANTIQFLGSPYDTPTGSGEGNGLLSDDVGALHVIAGDEEESLDVADQEALAAVAA